jgi:hypothetical protein
MAFFGDGSAQWPVITTLSLAWPSWHGWGRIGNREELGIHTKRHDAWVIAFHTQAHKSTNRLSSNTTTCMGLWGSASG